MARVLIAGCGYVGSALAERLTRAGHEVWGLRREAGAGLPGAGLPGGVQPFIADLCDQKSLENLPSDLDFVFYTAAAEASTEAAYRAAYIDGLENILSALKSRNQNLKRFFLTSSTAVYGQDAGEWVDEDSPTEDSPARDSPSYGFRGRIIREAEALALGSGFPAVVVRFGGIYGPGRTRFMERALRGEFLESAASEQALGGEAHLGELPGGAADVRALGGQVHLGEMSESAANVRWGNRIHRDDCAGALHHLMNLTQVKSMYCVVDTEPAPQAEVARWLYERHVALKSAPAPGQPGSGQPAPGRAAAIARQEGASRDDRDIPPAGMRGKRCSSERIRAAGYRFRYPTYQEGYGALLASAGD